MKNTGGEETKVMRQWRKQRFGGESKTKFARKKDREKGPRMPAAEKAKKKKTKIRQGGWMFGNPRYQNNCVKLTQHQEPNNEKEYFRCSSEVDRPTDLQVL